LEDELVINFHDKSVIE